jgi:antitoxin HicB
MHADERGWHRGAGGLLRAFFGSSPALRGVPLAVHSGPDISDGAFAAAAGLIATAGIGGSAQGARLNGDSAMPDMFSFTVVLEPQAEGGFSVSVPALPEVVTEGDTEEEALAMAEDAIRLAVSYRRDHGIPPEFAM